jgi:nitrite reductase/ring-hydroxylating ferredoxin subunit
MLSRIFGFLRGRGVLIRGVDKLPEGVSRKVAIGDPLAGGTEIILCRVGGKLYAVDRVCPHEGGRIGDGPLAEGTQVVCPLHNYHFDAITGRAIGVGCRAAKTYKVVEKGSDCEVFGTT